MLFYERVGEYDESHIEKQVDHDVGSIRSSEALGAEIVGTPSLHA